MKCLNLGNNVKYMQDELSDEILIKAIANGDEQSFAKLVNKHSGRIYSTAYRVLSSDEDAKDVMQNCFTKIWTYAPKWNDDHKSNAKFTTWLHRVVVNLCIDIQRKKKHLPLIDGYDPADERQNVLQDVSDNETSKRVRAAVDSLPERQKIAFVLSFYEEHSNKETAEIMDISIGALQSLLIRAKKELQIKLEEERENWVA